MQVVVALKACEQAASGRRGGVTGCSPDVAVGATVDGPTVTSMSRIVVSVSGVRDPCAMKIQPVSVMMVGVPIVMQCLYCEVR